ncbi:MAG TPA: hypothetical protein PK777_10705 [Thermoguttaceae bacterium]|nr:hypothetical protein [Thermoguttaceae bacterium]HPP53412.1 hypothetical protein [Thermoguttaceae bacterium]
MSLWIGLQVSADLPVLGGRSLWADLWLRSGLFVRAGLSVR